jgi:hypothetical protein
VIAGIERLEHGGRRRHAGGKQQRPGLGLFQHGQNGLRLAHGGIVGTAVDIARGISIVLVTDIGGRHMDRQHHGFRDRIHMAQSLSGQAALRPLGTR